EKPAPARAPVSPAPVIETAFVSRIKSTKRPVAVGAFAGLLFAISCGVAAFVFRSSEASNLSTELPPVQTASEVRVGPPKPVENSISKPAANADIPLSDHVMRKSPEMRQVKPGPIVDANVVEEAPSREEPPVAVPEVEKPKPREAPVKSAPN